MALAPGVPLLLGYAWRRRPAAHTVASQTAISLHSPDALTITRCAE